MADIILSGLNDAQREAVTSPADIVQVLAPPGSGKTKTLTARVAYLLEQRQLKPWNIIVCTFTVKAASEMKERITKFVGRERAKQLKLGTFHSVALRYLKQYGQYIGLSKDFGIADTSDSKAIVNRIIKQNRFTINAGQARGRISTQKAKGISCEKYAQNEKKVEQQEFLQIYRQYEELLKASNLLDYDDILLRCCDLLRNNPGSVSNVEALLIDEFQDTNNIQYDLMGLFAQHRKVITIVGDPDQSIYGFRSAESANLGRMKLQWPDTLTINLAENYRSSGAILHAAQHIIEQDEARPPKKLQATHTFGHRPVLRKLPSAAAEADWLVSEVKRIQALTGNLLAPNDFAVLLRSAALSRVIETALGKQGVPYRMIGGVRFYDRAEVKLLLDYLRVVDSPGNNEAVERIINMPVRGLGDATVKALRSEAHEKGVSLWAFALDIAQGRCKPKKDLKGQAGNGLSKFVGIILAVRSKSAATASGGDQATVLKLLQCVLKKLDYQTYLKHKYPDEYDARWLNVEELIVQATDASDPARMQTMLEVGALPAVDDFEQRLLSAEDDALSLFLANIALTASSEQKADADGEKVQQLTISTIHAAKGLEWPVVFIPACYDGSIPHSRADDSDEERRLLYVGMTRAKALLYVSSPLRNSQREEACLSTFLAQPGVSRFFDEHGPSISVPNVQVLATTLGRELPSANEITTSKQALERDEDNYWPLTGEEPLGTSTQWESRDSSHAGAAVSTRPLAGFAPASTTIQPEQELSTSSASMRPGFVSAKAQYEDVLEQQRLQKVDKRAAQAKVATDDKPKGRKRQIEGQGTIASFFMKRCRSEEEAPATGQGDSRTSNTAFNRASGFERAKQPLQEVHDLNSLPIQRPALPRQVPERKLPSVTVHRKPPTQITDTSDNQEAYIFLSSSPPQPENDGTSETVPTSDAVQSDNNASSFSRPAVTMHTTSMQQAAPQRKTLGMRRSMQGWSARGGRG